MKRTIDISLLKDEPSVESCNEQNTDAMVLVKLWKPGFECCPGEQSRAITVAFGALPTDVYWEDIQDKPTTIVTSGKRLFLNGVEITNNPSMQQAVANAKSHWYGSYGAYREIADAHALQTGTVYHVDPQSDWNETDPNSLAYIMNKPDITDMEVIWQKHR